MTYIAEADDKKIKGMYLLLEDEIEQESPEYSDAFKKELNRRYEYYKNGGKMISSSAVNKEINSILKKKNK